MKMSLPPGWLDVMLWPPELSKVAWQKFSLLMLFPLLSFAAVIEANLSKDKLPWSGSLSSPLQWRRTSLFPAGIPGSRPALAAPQCRAGTYQTPGLPARVPRRGVWRDGRCGMDTCQAIIPALNARQPVNTPHLSPGSKTHATAAQV